MNFPTSRIARLGLVLAVLAGLAAPPLHAAEPRLQPAVPAANATHAELLASAQAGARLVAVGAHGTVLLSDDGGRQWRQAQAVPVDCTLTSVSFVDARNGWIAGHWGAILVTRDGGEHWSVQHSDTQEDRPLFGLHMLDAQRGVAVGLWSLVLRTTDGGAHWERVELPPPAGAKRADLNLMGLFAGPGGALYAPAERGLVLRSDDGGQRWDYLGTGYAGTLWSGTAAADGALLVGGLRGSLYRSADEGRSWTRIETGSKSSITALRARERAVTAVGLDGLSLHSIDAGASFTARVRPDHLPLTAVERLPDGREVLLSRAGVVAP